jgi:hypothetical protein
MEVKARVTPDNRFIQLIEYTELELEQISHSFKKRITNWRFHPLVKKKNMGWLYFFHGQAPTYSCWVVE